MYTLSFALAALATTASVVRASPTLAARQNDYCSELLTICSGAPNSHTNPWSSKACIFGATCFQGTDDDFLAALGSSLKSHDAPRVTQSVFNSISTDGQVITQQNYIDGVFGTLQTAFPDASLVINDYNRVADWTVFCDGQGIPFMNFADYYQFSATVSSSGCSCNKMFTTCVSQVNKAVSDAWSHPTCIYAASCIGGSKPVDTLLANVFKAKGGQGTAPVSTGETRVSTATMQAISTDGTGISQQNFIDGYFGTLSSLGSPFFPTADLVIGYFNVIRSWTGFCSGDVPFMNFADYFQFSSSVPSSLC